MKHVLAVRLDSAGDVLLTGPAVRAVASTADRVSYLCGPKGADAARMLPGVDEVLVHRAAWIDPDSDLFDPDAVTTLIAELASRRISQAVIFTSFHQSPLPTALLLRMAGVEITAAISDDFPGALLDVRHRVDPDLHEVERNLSLVATLGFRLASGDDGTLRVKRDSAGFDTVSDSPFVVVHPGSAVPARTATPELFAEVVELLLIEGWRVVVTGTKEESGLTRAVSGRRLGVTDLGGKTTLSELASVLGRASAIVVGNTGPAHLAAAVGTPVVELYPPTVPASRWRPWGVSHVLLGDQEISCSGCRAASCPLPIQMCLASVTAEQVVGGVRKAISDRDYLHPAHAVGTVLA